MSISIHLMLLFIDNGRSNENNKQTISIHLMLLFIDYEFPRMFNFTEISIHLMLLFIISSPSSSFTVCDFNTSHVTVYRDILLLSSIHRTFQYISCYCLSVYPCCTTVSCRLFQYISCYCLSRCIKIKKLIIFISIHLMLLFIHNPRCYIQLI